MKTFALIACLALLSPGSMAGRSPQEPPQRVRVTVGDEVIELMLGGPGGVLADGRAVAVQLLPTRVFAVKGAFTLEYPDGWRFSGTGVADGNVDAWWTLGGERVHLYLRRHDKDAQAILEEYMGNCEATGATGRRPASIDLGGHRLEGFRVDKEIGSMHGGASTHAVFEVYAWQEREGVAWLVQIQRDTPAPTNLLGLVFPTIQLDDSGQPTPVAPASDPKPDELAVILESFRWSGE